MKCRHCVAELNHTVLDLGAAPPSNAYLRPEQMHAPETWYPLRLLLCDQCWLVQTEDYAGRETLFPEDYAYFSSISTSWLAHARAYVDMAAARFGLGSGHTVVEIAANDGYLLKFVKQRGIACYGVEPTKATAAAARAKDLDIIVDFFGRGLAQELVEQGRAADLIVANNVLAHVPDINDFLAGIVALLKPHGVASFEFPHLLRMVQEKQFDTAYHEHYSYFSLIAIHQIFLACGLTVFDVEELGTHGGSLRVYAQRAGEGRQQISGRVAALLERERAAGVDSITYYSSFQGEAESTKDNLLRYLLEAKGQGLKVAAYGAAAKGNTLLNFAGVRHDLLPYVADRSPAKQGRFLPGSRIPIVDEVYLQERRPDRVLILPWNLRQEVMTQLAYIRAWGGKFVVSIPQLEEA